jgi:hypothetical protein
MKFAAWIFWSGRRANAGSIPTCADHHVRVQVLVVPIHLVYNGDERDERQNERDTFEKRLGFLRDILNGEIGKDINTLGS